MEVYIVKSGNINKINSSAYDMWIQLFNVNKDPTIDHFAVKLNTYNIPSNTL